MSTEAQIAKGSTMIHLTFTVTVIHPEHGVTYEEGRIAQRDVMDLVAALYSEDRGENVLAENGLYSPEQTVTITGKASALQYSTI